MLERNRRLALPLVPLRVGLVTSAGSAAYHDFVQELKASGLAFRVGVVDVRVQGAAASRRIVYGLRQMAGRDLDVVVVARGGGSRADLGPFDTDTVARVIADMPVPVITGVGHEVDRSVADEVAHTSCKTPTACAQLLVDACARLRAGTRHRVAPGHAAGTPAHRHGDTRARRSRAARATRRACRARARERAIVERHAGRVEELARMRARDASRGLDDRARRVGDAARLHVRDATRALDDCGRRLEQQSRARLREATLGLDGRAATVRALDPRRVLERGYSITRDEAGRAVRRVDATATGAQLHTELADGVVVSTVERIEPATTGDGGDD